MGSPWKETEASTIMKCFKNAGFPVTSDGVPECPEQAEEVPELDPLSNEIYGCDLQDLPGVVQNLATCHTQTKD